MPKAKINDSLLSFKRICNPKLILLEDYLSHFRKNKNSWLLRSLIWNVQENLDLIKSRKIKINCLVDFLREVIFHKIIKKEIEYEPIGTKGRHTENQQKNY